MRRFLKVCVVSGIILILLGTGITSAAAVLGARSDWLFEDHFDDIILSDDRLISQDFGLHSANGQEKGGKTFSGVTKLDIELQVGLVSLVPSTEDVVRVTIEGDYNNFQCEMDGTELNIEADGTMGRDFHNGNSMEVTVYIPEEGQFEQISLETSAGNIIAGSIDADRLDIDVKAGSVTAEKVNVNKCKIDVKAGEAVIWADAISILEAECKTGSIEINAPGLQSEYNYYIESSMGDIAIGDDNYAGLHSKKQIDNQATKTMDLECKAGDISIAFVK